MGWILAAILIIFLYDGYTDGMLTCGDPSALLSDSITVTPEEEAYLRKKYGF